MRKRSELIFSLILVPVDVAALLNAFVAAYLIRVRLDHRPVAYPISGIDFLKLAIIVMPVWILIFAFSGLYSQSNLRGRVQELGKVFVAVSGGVMFMILLDFISRHPIFPSRSVPIYAYGLGLVLVALARSIVRLLQRSLFPRGIGVHRILLVGSGDIALRLRKDLDNKHSGYKVVGVIDSAHGASRRMSGLPVYQDISAAVRAFKGKDPIDGVIQGDSALDPDEVMEIVNYASNHHLAYHFVPNQFGLYALNSTFSSLAGVPMIELRVTPLDGWGRILKRAFDLLGALVGFVFFVLFFVIVGIIMQLTDRGPVLYKNRRLSRNGKEIYLYKFRSMLWEYCDGPDRPHKTAIGTLTAMERSDLIPEFERNQKLANDPRVSRLGRFLRRSSLDELPQVLNVLRGDMSLVGPRPILAEELSRYGEGAPIFLALKPGLTGLWQISGRSDISYEERVKLDIYYVEHWSLGLDIEILLKTVFSVFSRHGAV